MEKGTKKIEVVKKGVRLEEEVLCEENGPLKVRTNVRAGLRATGLGCGGPNECLAAR